MFRIKLSAFCAALMLAAPAYAQSSMTMIIGPAPTARPAPAPATGDSTDELVEKAAEAACARPFIRDLKGRITFEACMAEARAQARAQVAALAQLARR